MVPALLVSTMCGLGWNLLAVRLMGGPWKEALSASWLAAGALAGALAGWFTVWSRRRRGGEESFAWVLANFYVGILAYWATFVVIERARLCWNHRGWTDFDLIDHLGLIVWFVFYGTLYYGILLIPLTYVSRWLVWNVYERTAAD